MKVRDLIKKLQKFPQNADVYIANHDYSLGQGDDISSVSFLGDEDPNDSDDDRLSSKNLCGTNSVIIHG
jgi:hypothetical protein